MTPVPIPPHLVSLIQSQEVESWLMENTKRSVIGSGSGEGFELHFEDEQEAEAFKARWLV